MPLPKPKKNESKDKFIDRCMDNKAMNKEYSDASQRRAVCESQWDGQDKTKGSLKHIVEHLSSVPWAILPETLDTIHNIVATRLYQGKLSSEEIETCLCGNGNSDSDPYMIGDTKVIPIYGTISKRMNLFSHISGGTSTELLKQDIVEALLDSDVKSIILDIESPGGSVDGPFELSDFIYNSRGSKPICAFANGLMASAAYLIGSATDKIVGSQTAQVGSIGVVTVHYDYSKQDEKMGVKRKYLTSGKYKAIGNDSEPLTKEGEAYIQENLDYYYTLFINVVARNRDVSIETVLADMADGRIFIGEQAKNVGLVDSIDTFEGCLMYNGENVNKTNTCAKTVGTKITEKEVTQMTLAELKKDNPETYKELMELAKTDVKAETETKFKTEKETIEQGFSQEISGLKDEMSKKDERILKLEKKDTIREEVTRKAEADRIWSDKLAESSIPEHLTGKVRPNVSYTKFVKDGQLDVEAFSTAVDGEIKDWESKGISTEVLGTGFSVKGTEDDKTKKLQREEKADDDLVDDIFALSGAQKEVK